MMPADPHEARHFHDVRARLAQLSPAEAAPVLREMAQRVRHDDLHMVYRAGLGHLGGDFSVADILVTLYAGVLNVDPLRPLSAERDRLVLSKGHTAGALYATLARCGFFAHHELETFAAPQSALNGHPNRTKVPGVETNTGPLGHGFPVGVGIALAAKWHSFGWEVREVDGHDHAQLLSTFRQPGTTRPVCVIAHTVKGKGVSFMEDRVEWHHKVPSADQLRIAVLELSA